MLVKLNNTAKGCLSFQILGKASERQTEGHLFDRSLWRIYLVHELIVDMSTSCAAKHLVLKLIDGSFHTFPCPPRLQRDLSLFVKYQYNPIHPTSSAKIPLFQRLFLNWFCKQPPGDTPPLEASPVLIVSSFLIKDVIQRHICQVLDEILPCSYEICIHLHLTLGSLENNVKASSELLDFLESLECACDTQCRLLAEIALDFRRSFVKEWRYGTPLVSQSEQVSLLPIHLDSENSYHLPEAIKFNQSIDRINARLGALNKTLKLRLNSKSLGTVGGLNSMLKALSKDIKALHRRTNSQENDISTVLDSTVECEDAIAYRAHLIEKAEKRPSSSLPLITKSFIESILGSSTWFCETELQSEKDNSVFNVHHSVLCLHESIKRLSNQVSEARERVRNELRIRKCILRDMRLFEAERLRQLECTTFRRPCDSGVFISVDEVDDFKFQALV